MDGPPALVVATANSASGQDRSGSGPPAAGPAWGLAAAGLGVDVLAVQEVDHLLPRSGGRDQTADLAAACAGDGPPWHARFAAALHGTPGSADTSSAAPRTEPDVPSYGVALLSRYPVVRWSELRMAASRARLPVPLPPGAGARVLWAPDEQRVALAAVVVSPVGEVAVVCTHLSFAPTRAVAQLRELRAWARALPRPLLLLGDLNLPGRVPARVTGWTGAGVTRTYPAGRPRVQLDHVLLAAGDHGVRLAPPTTHALAGSDHLALRTVLSRA